MAADVCAEASAEVTRTTVINMSTKKAEREVRRARLVAWVMAKKSSEAS
jgi:hypothetical protein